MFATSGTTSWNGALDNRMASYGDAMVATAGLLSAMNLPQVTQGYWTEHSERAVIPTGLSVLENPPTDKDILGRWKPEGSDTYARSYGGRVARLQAIFATAARNPNHYEVLDEREIASGLKDWLVGKDKLPEEATGAPFEEDTSGRPLEEPTAEAGSSEEEAIPSAKKLRTVDREASYVIVASPGGIFSTPSR